MNPFHDPYTGTTLHGREAEMLIHDAFDCGDTEWLSNYERYLVLVAGGGDDGGSGLGVVGFIGYGESVRGVRFE